MTSRWQRVLGFWREVWQGRRHAREAWRRLDSNDPVARWRALQALRAQPLGPGEIQRLVALLDDPDPFVRWETADLLAAQGGTLAVSACLRRLQAGGEAPGLAAAVHALGRLGDERALPFLLGLAEHADPEVRLNVATALGAFTARPEARDALRNLLHDRHPLVRRAAAWTLQHAQAAWAREMLRQRAAVEPLPWLRDLMQREAVPSSSPAEAGETTA